MKTKNLLQSIPITIGMIIAVSLMNQFADAQIVYTDIQPDVNKTCNKENCNKTYSLDLNNDGSSDFNIYAEERGNFCHGGYTYFVSVTPLTGNSIAFSAPDSMAFASGASINSLLTWTTASSVGLRYDFNHYDCAYGGWGSGSGGNWIATSDDRYLGLKIVSNSQTYYGWARLSVTVNSKKASFKIKDYAFDSTPGHSILAGATEGERHTEENSLHEKDLSLKVFPNPVSPDQSGSVTISFSLSESEKVSLSIFDLNGRLLATLADKIFEAGENELVWNTDGVSAGIYFLKFRSTEKVYAEKLIVTK